MDQINDKMPVILIGNSFKYEIEATLKLFFNAERFSFSDDISAASGSRYVIAKADGKRISAEVMLGGKSDRAEKQLAATVEEDRDTAEHELCRLIYHILSDRLGVRPPWGLMTGIRPVKKVIDCILTRLKTLSER